MAVTVERLEAEIKADPSQAIAGLTALEAVIGSAARDRTARIEVDVDHSPLDRLSGALDGVGNRTHRGRDAMQGFARDVRSAGDSAGGASGGLSSFSGGMGGIGSSAISAAGGMSMFSGHMAAAAAQVLLIIAIIPHFIALLNVAVGAILGLAGALAPVLGILTVLPSAFLGATGGIGALILGFGGIGEAVGAADSAQKALTGSRRSGTGAARDMRAAERALEQAVRSVTRAQEELARAQENVGEARKQAARNIRDLAHAAEEAVWNEEEAVMRLQEAQENLARTQNRTARAGMTLTKQTDEFTGKVYEVAYASEDAVDGQESMVDAQRAVIRAERDLTRAKERTKDAQEESNEANKKGVEGSDLVRDALRRVEDASRSLADAQYNVADAQRRLAEQAQAASAGLAGGSAAANRFKQAMAELTPEGRAFVNFLVNELKPAWKKVTDAAQAALLPPIQRGLEEVLAYMPRLETHATNFGATMGRAIEEFLGLFTGENADRTDVLFEGANRDLDKMLDTANLVADAILEVARVAEESGFTKWFTDAVAGWLGTMAEEVIAMAEDGRLSAWLKDVQTQSSLVWGFLSNVVGILGAVTEAGKPLGTQILQDLTGITGKWLEWMNTKEGQKTMKGWFDSIAEVLDIIWPLIEDIIAEFFRFGEDGSPVMEDFKDVIANLHEALPSVIEFLENMSPIIKGLSMVLKPVLDFLNNIIDALGNPLVQRVLSFLGQGIVPNLVFQGAQTAQSLGVGGRSPGGTSRSSAQTRKTSYTVPKGASWKMETTTVTGHRAAGGSVQRGLSYIVGERRPELFVPHTSGRVEPRLSSVSGSQTSLTPAQIESIVTRLAERMKPDVRIEQTYNEKVDPRLMASELAWRLT